MQAMITIDMDNAAFADDDAGIELARILRKLADDLADTPREALGRQRVRDYNGNHVGFCCVHPDNEA